MNGLMDAAVPKRVSWKFDNMVLHVTKWSSSYCGWWTRRPDINVNVQLDASLPNVEINTLVIEIIRSRDPSPPKKKKKKKKRKTSNLTRIY